VTIGAIRALRARGLHHSIALVGFDDFPLADLLEPAVTVIRRDVPGIGRAAAGRLFARIDGDRTPSRTVVVPTTYLPRGSGELRAP